MDEGFRILDNDEMVVRDSVREVKSNRTAFIYNDWVYQKTIDKLEELKIKYKVLVVKENNEFSYYQIEKEK